MTITPEFARHLTSDLGAVALAVSAYSIANLVGNLFAGLVVDRFKPAAVMSLGLVLGGGALASCGHARSIMDLIAGLMVNGAALSVVAPAASAMLSRELRPSDKGGGMARTGATIGVAALVGPPVGGLLADRLGPGVAYQSIGGFLLVVALLLAFALRREIEGQDDKVPMRDLWRVLVAPELRLSYLAAFALMFANGGLVFALPTHVRGLGYSGASAGLLFSAFALCAIAVFVSRLGTLGERWGHPRSAALGGMLLAVGCGALAFLKVLPLMATAMALYGVGFGLVFASGIANMATHAPQDRKGTAFALFYAVFSLGAIAGPFALSLAGRGGVNPFLVAALVPALFALGLAARKPLTWRT